MFPLQSDDIFRSDTRCHLLSCTSFACTTPVPSHACSCPIPPISASNCKNIHCHSASSSSRNFDRVSKPAYPIVSSSDSVTNISRSPKFTSTNSHSINSSISKFRVVSHRNIHRKPKLRKSLIGSAFVNSPNSHDIANKRIVGRDGINVLTI